MGRGAAGTAGPAPPRARTGPHPGHDREASATLSRVGDEWFAVVTAGSECGRLVAATDWSSTSLGHPSRWSSPLRAAVSICLTSRFPMLVTWGPELVKIYNDGYSQLLGDKHPRAMGATVPEVWPEIIDVIGPMLERVTTTGEPTWDVDQLLYLHRRGFDEECYFTYSYSPIFTEDGRVGGVLDTVAETTEQVIGTRRLACLGLLAARLATARDVDDVIAGSVEVLGGFTRDIAEAWVHLRGDEVAPGGVRFDFEDVVVVLVPSRNLPFDDAYRSFFELVAGAIARGVHDRVRHARELDDLRDVSDALQRAMLTHEQHPCVAVRYVPAVDGLAVGGDWYDVLELPSDRLAVMVGDCVGHGLEAATRMGQLRSASRALLLEGHGPASLLEALDRFAASIEGATATTVCCAIVDRAAGTLTHARAGHPPPVLRGADGVSLLEGGRGVPLGCGVPVARCDATVPLRASDTLVLYTDGLVERRGESLDVGFARLVEAVGALGHRPVEDVADGILRRLVPGGSGDDVAILVHREG